MKIKGFNLNEVNSFSLLLKNYSSIGIQATHLSQADEILEKIVKERECTFYLAFTSNIISSGLREIISQLILLSKPSVIITTAGAIEEDIMKSLGSFDLGTFQADDKELRKKGINRIGNIYVSSDNYIALEEFIQPLLNEIYTRKKTISVNELIQEISLKIKDKNSFLFSSLQTNTEIFCPAITDGALGVQLYLFKQKHPDFCIDIIGDMKKLADITMLSKKTGALIIGGGLAKHHTIGVNLLRDGLDYAVYISTATEHDASLSGAFPREAISWGKLKQDSKHVLVNDEASISLPLLVLSLNEKIGKLNKK
jgi:deoxyhypusine synthase